jgi:hypothetical protein
MPVEDSGFLTGLVPVLQRGGYFFRMPFYPGISNGRSLTKILIYGGTLLGFGYILMP